MLTKLFAIGLCFPLVLAQDEYSKNTTLSRKQNDDDIVFRVVNGKPATLGQIPYQVSLKSHIGKFVYANFCGGSIVGLQKILSAAHCFVSEGNIFQRACKKQVRRSLQNVYAVAGSLRTRGYHPRNQQTSEQWRTLRKFLIPDNYKFPRNDIAVAFTHQPFIFNQYVSALPMAQSYMDYGSIDCLTSGYGKINNRITSDSLLWANLRLIPMRTCSLLHGKNMNKFICTSSDLTDVLEGDSGGPLVCKVNDVNDRGQGVIVGVVSGAARSARTKKWMTFYTRVSSYRTFYLQNGETTPAVSQFCIYLLVPLTLMSNFYYFILFDFTR